MNPVEELAKVKGIGPVTVERAKAAGVKGIVTDEDTPTAGGPIDIDQGERYDLVVEWDAETVQVGVGGGGIRKLFMEGTVESRPSTRVRLAGKHSSDSDYEAFGFLPKHSVTGVDVYVNGEFVGVSQISYQSKYEWGIERKDGEDWGVTACHVRIPLDSPWLESTARSVGVVL